MHENRVTTMNLCELLAFIDRLQGQDVGVAEASE